jgi:hypothetical protein
MRCGQYVGEISNHQPAKNYSAAWNGIIMSFVRAGKVFPKLRRKGRTLPSLQNGEEAEDESTDYVFRIVSKAHHEDFCK